MTAHLGLDETQRAAIAAVLEEYMPRILAQREQVHDARRDLAAGYSDTEMDAARFRTLVQRLSAAQAALDSLAAEAMLGEAAVLSPEQRRSYVTVTPWGRLAARPPPPPPPPAPGPHREPPERPPGQANDPRHP